MKRALFAAARVSLAVPASAEPIQPVVLDSERVEPAPETVALRRHEHALSERVHRSPLPRAATSLLRPGQRLDAHARSGASVCGVTRPPSARAWNVGWTKAERWTAKP